MNYWLDIRLKIIRFFRKHKKKIIVILIIWAVIFAINYYLKHREKIIVPQTTYEPHSPVMDTISDNVPEKFKEPINNLIHNYIEYCNNKEYENAYNLLSESYKALYCNNIENFKKYVDNKFATKKIYNIQNFSNLNETYVYRVRLLDDILANGTTDEYAYTEEKYVIKEENGILKISLNGYCGSQDLNIEVEDDNMRIKIIKKDMEYDSSTYTVQFTNKTNYYIVLVDSTTSKEILLKLPNDEREATNMIDSNLVILPNETYERKITFNEYFDDEQEPTNLKFNSIRILPEFTGHEENAQKENENAIKLYSLSIDLIPQERK